ncbi:MAG: hypothetical protein HUU01_23080, partial [Saprospiraceae bacterium]|nr:hypothetical protein [Saprospiraceae bacterium]
SVFMPGILRQFGFLFGVEWTSETLNASGEQVLLNENYYRLVPEPKRPTGAEKIRLFNSSMYQYNHYGTFLQLFARRAISQFAPYALGQAGVGAFVTDLVSLIFNSDALPGRYVQRRFETVQYDYPALQIVLDESKTTETYSGGGTTTQTLYLNYLQTTDRELLVNNQTVIYSDSNVVQTQYHYAFQSGTPFDTILLHLHDPAALTYLNTEDYQQPVATETFVNGTRTQIGLTALTLHGSNKLAPRANYGLQNGNRAFIGKFGGYNDDAKPTHYLLAKFGTLESNTSPAAYFDTIHLSWHSHLNLPLHKRKYLEFETTQNYSGFYEYAGNVDHNGVTTTYEYDKRGRLDFTSVLNGHQVTKYTYTIGPGINSILMETDYQTGEEMNIRQAIDGFGKETKRTRENDGAILNTKEYDGFWRVVAERNIGTGIVTKEYEASPLSKLLTTLDQENNIFSYEYKGQTAPSTSEFKTIIVTDPNGHANESHYNSLEQLTRTFNDPEESQVIYSYDQLLRPSEITNPIGEKFTYDYNEMGLLWKTTVPGRGPQSVWYDHKFRPVASSDGNNHYILTQYDDFDRPEKTYLYETGFSLSGAGISNADQSSYYEPDHLLSAVGYVADSKTWVNHTENRLLEGGTPDTLVMVISDNTLDDIGRVVQSVTEYPDEVVKTTLAHSSAGYLLASQREIVLEGDTTVIGDEFEHDNVLRPLTHKVFYGDDRWVLANRMAYNIEDHLLIKWVGGMPMEDDRFLQEVNYAYDSIGRLIRINNTGTFFCNIEEEVCAFSLELTFPLLWENCDVISGIKINGEVYPLDSPLDLLTQQRLIGPAIEAILHAYGLGGKVSANSEEYPGGQTLTIRVKQSNATELSLILSTCGQEVAFTADCCTIPPAQPIPNIPRSPEDPEVCTADLYHQLMRYDGLDINQITMGSGCGVMMRNNYEYDGLHRITAMKNVLFGPTPFPDAFSNTYSYDKAGNIQQLMRRGIVGMSGSTPESDTIDLLQYTYAGSGGVS